MTKLCINCKHAYGHSGAMVCAHPDLMKKSLVDGRLRYADPELQRASNSRRACGKEGRFWEPRGKES